MDPRPTCATSTRFMLELNWRNWNELNWRLTDWVLWNKMQQVICSITFMTHRQRSCAGQWKSQLLRTYFYVFFKIFYETCFLKMFFSNSMYVFFISKTFIILTWPKEPQDKCLFVNLFFSLDSEWTNKVKAYARKQCLFCFILAHGYLLSLIIII